MQIENLIQEYKDNGEQEGEDPALLMLKLWPASSQYKDNSDQLQGLGQKVCKLISVEQYPVCLSIHSRYLDIIDT